MNTRQGELKRDNYFHVEIKTRKEKERTRGHDPPRRRTFVVLLCKIYIHRMNGNNYNFPRRDVGRRSRAADFHKGLREEIKFAEKKTNHLSRFPRTFHSLRKVHQRCKRCLHLLIVKTASGQVVTWFNILIFL